MENSHPRQCKLCKMGVGREEGLSQREIAKKYGLGSKSSVGRHLKYLEDQGSPQPLVGTMSPSGVNPSLVEEKVAESEDEQSLDELIIAQGDDPSSVEITAKEVKAWDVGNGEVRKSFRVAYKPRSGPSDEPLDIQGLFDRASRVKPSKAPSGKENRALVVIWADTQTGKVDRNGGTPELIERIAEKQEALREYAAYVNAGSAFMLDAGDVIEGFENTGQQQFTNDLSLMEQVELEASFELDTLTLLAGTHSKVVQTGIPSNHCGWRKGKSYLGKPGDDWGVFIKKQNRAAMALNPEAFGHVETVLPNPWDEMVTVDVLGHGIGLVHGHQVSKPDDISNWWGKQLQIGSLWDAEILVHGHFHHFRAKQDGRHPKTKAQKYVLSAPALDNGSSWVHNGFGSDSDAGLMAFVVERDKGFVFNSLVIL